MRDVCASRHERVELQSDIWCLANWRGWKRRKGDASSMWRWIIRAVLATSAVYLIVTRLGHREPRYGFPVRVVTTDCEPIEENIFHGRMVRLLVDNDGRTFINTEYCPPNLLHSRLSTIYSTRSQRVLHVDAGDSVPFQTAIDLVNHSQSDIEGLSVVLITPAVRKRCEWRWAPIQDVFPSR